VTLPADIAPDELNPQAAEKLLKQAGNGGKELGQDPETDKPVYLKTGRFGPYVQLGDAERTEKGALKRGGKPKMASLWPEMSPETVTLEEALEVLSFPRTLGEHPETGQPVTVQDGKYGPYVKMGDETRSLENHAQLRTIRLDEALQLLAQPKRRGKRAAPATLNELGTHPNSGEPVVVKSGRYGPYVTDGTVNASLPKGLDPVQVTLEKAVELITNREQRLRDQGKDPRAPKASRKGTSKKSASRK
jgi:DNA topoisomerase-1